MSRKQALATTLPRNSTLRSTGLISSAPMHPVSISWVSDLPRLSTPVIRNTTQMSPGNAVRNCWGSSPIANWNTSRVRTAKSSIESRCSLRRRSMRRSFQTRTRNCWKTTGMGIIRRGAGASGSGRAFGRGLGGGRLAGRTFRFAGGASGFFGLAFGFFGLAFGFSTSGFF